MTDPDRPAARTAAATAASVAKRRRGRQERLAAELSAAGWHSTPPEADPIPDEPGVYLSDTLWGNAAVRAAGAAALGLWHYALMHPARTVVDGYAAIHASAIPRTIGSPELRQRLVDTGLWEFHKASGCYLFLHPGVLYAIVGKQATRDSRSES
jgi:hypothetical protein